MKNILKAAVYYIVSFVIFVVAMWLLDLNTLKNASENANVFVALFYSMKITVTSELRLIAFITIFSIPFILYLTGKYIEKLNDETDEMILYHEKEDEDKSSDSYKKMITQMQREYLDFGKLTNNNGLYAGIVNDGHKYKELYVSLKNNDLTNALIVEKNEDDIKYLEKVISGIIAKDDNIIILDEQEIIEDSLHDLFHSKNYEISKIDLEKYEKGIRINLFNFLDTKEKISEVSNIIAKEDKYRAKLLETLIYIVKNSENIREKNFIQVCELAESTIKTIEEKARFISDAYEAYNELVLLNDKEKEIVLKDLKYALENFKHENLNKDSEDLSLTKRRQRAFFISIPSVCIGNTVYAVVLNLLTNNRNVVEKSKKTYILIPNINKFDCMFGLVDKMKQSRENKMFYILTISNMKEFKSRFQKESKKIFDYSDIKVFYSFRQYETIALLKTTLMLDEDGLKNIIESLDTSKCLICAKGLESFTANIDIPSGIVYEKYKYGENKNYDTMSKLKSIDMKLKVDYLQEFDERNARVEEHKDTNFKPEITREEKEYIAELLKDKDNFDSNFTKKLNDKSFSKLNIKDNDLFQNLNNEEDKFKNIENIYDLTDNESEDEEEVVADDEDINESVNNVDIKETSYKENKSDEDEDIIKKKEKELERKLKNIENMQASINQMISKERKNSEHAIYDQMKDLK